MFRVVFLAFFARPHHPGQAHHGVPRSMNGVCWVLAAFTLALGLRLAFGGHHGEQPAWLPWLSLALAGAGIVLAWAMYQRGAVDPARVASLLGPLGWAARRRYGLDALFGGLYRFVLLTFARLVGWIDRYLVDGVLNVLSAWTLRAGDRLRRLQTGLAQDYVYGVALGTLVLFVLAQWRLR
jgi:NADH-quinone oxidoreductase subunit L